MFYIKLKNFKRRVWYSEPELYTVKDRGHFERI